MWWFAVRFFHLYSMLKSFIVTCWGKYLSNKTKKSKQMGNSLEGTSHIGCFQRGKPRACGTGWEGDFSFFH